MTAHQRHGPGVEPLSRRDVLAALAAAGHDRRDAEAMLAEHVHRTSYVAGTPTYQWGLDTSDVDAIADRYAWLRHGEALDDARNRAADESARLAELAGRADLPEGYRAWAQQSAQVWADRATPTPSFSSADSDDGRADGTDSTEGTDQVATARAAVAAVPYVDDELLVDGSSCGVPPAGDSVTDGGLADEAVAAGWSW